MSTKILDHDTKQLLLSAIRAREETHLAHANDLLRQAAHHDAEGETATAAKLCERAEVYADMATKLRRLWNDAKPVDVRIQLT